MIVLRDKGSWGAPLWGLLFLVFITGCATSRMPHPSIPFYPTSVDDPDSAALRMVAEYWNPGSARAVPALAPDDLHAFWAAHGLWSCWIEGTYERLRERTAGGLPMLVPLHYGATLEPSRLRLAVVAGVQEPEGEVLLYGLAQEPVTLQRKAFMTAWEWAGTRLLVVAPGEGGGTLPWSLTSAERLSRGRYAMTQGQPEAGLSDFEAALAQSPDRAQPYIETADALLQLNRCEEAAPLYRAALQLDGLQSRAMNNLAYLLMTTGGDLNEALQLARNAVALEPDNPRLLDTLGGVHHRRGELREASRVLERARTRAMKESRATQSAIARHLIEVYHDEGAVPLARQTLADTLKINPAFYVPPEWNPYLRAEHPVYR